MGGADTSPTSLIVHLWIYTALAHKVIRALKGANLLRETGRVWYEYELTVSPASAQLRRNSSRCMGALGEEPLCAHSATVALETSHCTNVISKYWDLAFWVGGVSDAMVKYGCEL
jgi:hypothetical protein